MLKGPTVPPPNPQADGLGYNPRCLIRDINLQAAAETTDDKVVGLIENHGNIMDFQTIFQGEFPQGRMGVHTGGHYTIGGDAGSDFYNSVADPAFFPHHAMIDRVWWIWQNQDVQKRQMEMQGSTNINGEGVATLDDVMTMGPYVGAANITIRDAMNTLAGPFCYIYV